MRDWRVSLTNALVFITAVLPAVSQRAVAPNDKVPKVPKVAFFSIAAVGHLQALLALAEGISPKFTGTWVLQSDILGIVGIPFQSTQKLIFSMSAQFKRINKDLAPSHSATICMSSYLRHVAPILALRQCGPPWKGKTLNRNETGEDVLDNCGAPLQRQFWCLN